MDPRSPPPASATRTPSRPVGPLAPPWLLPHLHRDPSVHQLHRAPSSPRLRLVVRRPALASGLHSSGFTSFLRPSGSVGLLTPSSSTLVLCRSGSTAAFWIPACASDARATGIAIVRLEKLEELEERATL
ncbi:hypothetical protein PO909_020730 [Leuciscus waleckii]